MFVRFVTDWIDRDSCEAAGLFEAVKWAKRHGYLTEADRDRLGDLLVWFGLHLPVPPRFNRSRRPHPKNKAISWFKGAARRHITRAREMVAIISGSGCPMYEVKTRRPGYIVYEDRFQVIA